ncbi:MAG: chitobiase/beta-hexosaminidase C-terminal domain-containing protein, partial [Firmicutes bacterium]|nr:chitobiase/beta-hexosaminidase C-terminal domain-containing protein [Bacillota bacterium]
SKGHVIEGNKSDISGYEVINSGIAAVDCDTEVKDIKAYGADNIDEVRLNIELCGLLREQGLIDETEDMIAAMPYSAIKRKLQNELDTIKADAAICRAEASFSQQDCDEAQARIMDMPVEVDKTEFISRLNKIKNQLTVNAACANYVSVAPSGNPEQKAAFDNRNSDESINELGEEFFKLIDLTKPGLEYAKRMVIEGNYKEALRAFKIYFLNKLRNYDDDDYLLLFDYAGYAPGETDAASTTGAELLNNAIQNSQSQKVRLPEPGTIDWEYDPPKLDLSNSYARSAQYMLGMSKFHPLLNEYSESGNIAYLDKWNAFLADWSMHQHGIKELLPANISDGFQNTVGGTMVNFMVKIRNLALNISEDGEGLEDFAFINSLKTIWQYFPPVQFAYIRSNPQNWTDATVPYLMGFAILYDEFIGAEEYFEEGIRELDSLLYLHKLPDGTSPEQDPTYNRNFLDYATKIETLRIIEKYRPHFMTEFRLNRLRDMQAKSADFFTHILKMNDSYPDGFRIDNRVQYKGVKDSINRAYPEALEDPDNFKIFSMLESNNFNQTPSFNSEFYPYGGYYALREGWLPTSQFGFLFSSPAPGVYGSTATLGVNSVSLAAFGQDMLLTGMVGHYGSFISQMLVDSLNANGVYGLYRWAHRNVMAPVWDDPADVRWHTSDKFDVAEGVFDGMFSTVLYEAEAANAAINGRLPGNYKEISDVDYQRVFSFLRETGIWIITDRMMGSTQPHNYTQTLMLPADSLGTTQLRGYKSFNSALIELDNANKTAKTQNDDRPNLSIYQFSTAPVSMAGVKQAVSPGSNKISDFYKVNTTFSGEGDQMLITLLYPRETKGVELASVTPISGDGVAGFSAVVNEGKTVSYLAANSKDGLLSIGNITMQGESLAIVENGGEVTGYAMGCNSFSIDGIAQTVLSADFEFSIISNTLQIKTKIYKSLKEVTILPEADVFTDSVDVTLQHEEDVDIYYTLDGSEPTLLSPKYTEPISLTGTTMVKAKAYRKDLAAEPQKMNGTLTSVAKTAEYIKMPYLESADITGVENGLNYRYYEAPWQLMYTKSGMDALTPKKAGRVDRLLDISPKETDVQFGFRYNGYIDIPQDGVYTFYKPAEMHAPYIVGGYELKLFIDGQSWKPIVYKQSYGTWSIPLKKGLHTFEVDYSDARGNTPEMLNGKVHFVLDRVWSGDVPTLQISGPNLAKQPIPDNMLFVSSFDSDEIKAEASFYFDGKNDEPPVDITKIGITSGEIITKYSIENNSNKTLEGRLITALYKVEDGSINLVECKISEDVLSLESGNSDSIEQAIFVPSDGKDYKIYMMLWDSIDNMKCEVNKVEFK